MAMPRATGVFRSRIWQIPSSAGLWSGDYSARRGIFPSGERQEHAPPQRMRSPPKQELFEAGGKIHNSFSEAPTRSAESTIDVWHTFGEHSSDDAFNSP
jgi:hypothetical protein